MVALLRPHAYDRAVFRAREQDSWRCRRLAVAAALIAAACFSGDDLGFVPCADDGDCDAPPKASARRDCIHVESDTAAAGYCALPCTRDEDCGGEAPTAWGVAATCIIPAGSDAGACGLPCTKDAPCPADQQCRGYGDRPPASCDDDPTCICFPSGG